MTKNPILPPFWKGFIKLVHKLCVLSIILGMIASVVILIQKIGIQPNADSFTSDKRLFHIITYAVNYPFFGIIATSILFSLFTGWGFFKFRWIVIKWIFLVIVFSITCFITGPAVNGMASISDAGFHMTDLKPEYLALQKSALFYLIVEIIGLGLIIAISVTKPFGPTGWKLPANPKAVFITLLVLSVLGGAYGIFSSIQFSKLRNYPIQNSNLSGLKDGIYPGSADFAGYNYKVEVSIQSGRIISIRSLDNRKSPYAKYAEGVFRKIIRDQNANTDAITGATTTSKALMKAVESALAVK